MTLLSSISPSRVNPLVVFRKTGLQLDGCVGGMTEEREVNFCGQEGVAMVRDCS